MKKKLLTGGSGLLGRTLLSLDAEFVCPSHQEMDLTNRYQVETVVDSIRPKMIIHSAALVGSRPCDENPQYCIDLNVGGTINITRIARKFGIRLIYVSTDYVFSGDVGNYKEDDPTKPVNLYGASKLAGEIVVLSYDNSLVIRTSFYDSQKWKFDSAFVDQYTSRDRVELIANEILIMAKSNINGVFHLGTKRKSQFEIAQGIDAKITPVSIKNADVKLPRDTSLNAAKWWRMRKNIIE